MSWLDPGAGGAGVPPLREPRSSTPLADGEQSDLVPRPLLWAMKYHGRHRFDDEDHGFGDRLGEGDGALYVRDDGTDHCLLGRIVGWTDDGCTYCLVGRLSMADYERCVNEEAPLSSAFTTARDVRLCAAYDAAEGPSNVADVRRFRRGTDVPEDYLPPHPPVVRPPYL